LQITTLSETLDSSTPLQSFGSTADDICNGALEEFAASAPPSTSDTSKSAVYDRKLEEVGAASASEASAEWLVVIVG